MVIQDPNLQILNDKEVLVNILFQNIFTLFERTLFYFQPLRKKVVKTDVDTEIQRASFCSIYIQIRYRQSIVAR